MKNIKNILLILFLFYSGSALPLKNDRAPSGRTRLTQLHKEMEKLENKYETLKKRSEKLSPRFYSSASSCEGRLTTESGVPLSIADRTAQSTVYFTPFNGSTVSLYNGSNWTLYRFTEISLALSGLTSGANYDVFLYSNSGTPALELSTLWTNDTTRADALTTVAGVQLKSAATTRRYVGTIRTTGTTTTEDSAAKRLVWSYCGRQPRFLSVSESTNSWTYAVNSWRAVNASSANKVEYVAGMGDVLAQASGMVLITASSGQVNYYATGVGVDSSTANSAQLLGSAADASTKLQVWTKYLGYPGLGYHYLQWLERGATTSITVYGTAGDTTQYQSGMLAILR
jgi:hypothetical protein